MVDVITYVLFTLLLFNYLFCFLSECFACTYVQHVHALRVQRPEEGIGYPGTRVMGGCESPCGCWEQNLNHLQEQKAILATAPLLQPQIHNFKKVLLLLLVVAMCMCVCVHACAWMSWNVYGGQRTTSCSLFSPSTFMQVPRLNSGHPACTASSPSC